MNLFQKLINNKPVYYPYDINISIDELNNMFNEIDKLPEKFWFFDSYRKVKMACLYSGGGEFKHKSIIFKRKKEPLNWTVISKQLPFITKVIETQIKPLMINMGRVTILKTPSDFSLKEHVDCSKVEANDYHPKFRLVISGCRKGLYFLSENGKKFISGKFPCYIIDGSRVHGMINRSQQTKYTICIGAPWSGKFSEKGEKLAKLSISKFKQYVLLRESLGKVKRVVKYQN